MSKNINNKNIVSLSTQQEKMLFSPSLTSNDEVSSGYSATCANGEIIGRGFVVKPGWKNEGLWKATFMFRHDKVRYTGICFLAATSYNGKGGSSNALTSWEGSFPGAASYTSYTNANPVGYFDITVQKIDDTHVKLKSKALDRESIVEVLWLPNVEMVTCGARHLENGSQSSYGGPCRLKDLIVKIPLKEVFQLKDSNDNIIYEKPHVIFDPSNIAVPENTPINFFGHNMFIDYQNDEIRRGPMDIFNYTYSDGDTIRVYGVTKIELAEDTSDTILPYSIWITDANIKFKVPADTESLYMEKGYPPEKIDGIRVVNQKNLNHIYGTPNNVMIGQAKRNDAFQTVIYYWQPAEFSDYQKGHLIFVNGSYGRDVINRTLSNTSLGELVYSDANSRNPGKQGTVTIEVPSYYDSSNKTYYTGVKYQVEFSLPKLSEAYYFDVTYIE